MYGSSINVVMDLSWLGISQSVTHLLTDNCYKLNYLQDDKQVEVALLMDQLVGFDYNGIDEASVQRGDAA
jgi:hypothetical protein